tara:strand:- start:2096 stop:4405 length:2310 start_codon:yes stop_codon:yes gene_type:complete
MRQLLMNSLATPKTRIEDNKLVVEEPSRARNFFSFGGAAANARDLRTSMQLNNLLDKKAEGVADKLNTRQENAAKLLQTNAVENIELATTNRRETNRLLAVSDRKLKNLEARLVKTKGENDTKEKRKQLENERDIAKGVRAQAIVEAKEADRVVNMSAGRALAIKKLQAEGGYSLEAAISNVELMSPKDLEDSGKQFNAMNVMGPKMVQALKTDIETDVLNSDEGKLAATNKVLETYRAPGVVNDLNRASTRTQNLTGARIKQTTENEQKDFNSWNAKLKRGLYDFGNGKFSVDPEFDTGSMSQDITVTKASPETNIPGFDENGKSVNINTPAVPASVDIGTRQDTPPVTIPGSPDAEWPLSPVSGGAKTHSPRQAAIYNAQQKHNKDVEKQTNAQRQLRIREIREEMHSLNNEAKPRPTPPTSIFDSVFGLDSEIGMGNSKSELEGIRLDRLMNKSNLLETELQGLEKATEQYNKPQTTGQPVTNPLRNPGSAGRAQATPGTQTRMHPTSPADDVPGLRRHLAELEQQMESGNADGSTMPQPEIEQLQRTINVVKSLIVTQSMPDSRNVQPRERKVIPIPAIPTPATLPSQPIPPSRSPAPLPGPLPTGQPAGVTGDTIQGPLPSGRPAIPAPTAPNSASAEPAGMLQKIMQAGSVKAMGQDAAKSAVDSDGLFGQIAQAGSVKDLGQEKFKAALSGMLGGAGGGAGGGVFSKLAQNAVGNKGEPQGLVQQAVKRKLAEKLGSAGQLSKSSEGSGGKNLMNLIAKFFI